ncbi:sugar-binding transcriptional regulator [Peribacillus saganii]|uniref:Sugar-binding transcriptional regulator n=1 Tax=Peribacillus saganii TaxID=2303992 RepID=A0A372LEB7_9BACI|nr:sugar-binding transcriptional regulator [Peribacillus saganii]RFU64640.1 sugar-binding transcriptional regulator [Peribacillus saganii]
MVQEKLRLMVKVCQLYYQQGLNQQTIAARYGISRSQVSRMITTAKSEGLVEVKIRNPYSDESTLEKKLLHRFNIRDAIIVDTSEADSGSADILLAQAGAAFLESVFKDDDVVGVMAGKSIAALAREIKDPQKSNLQFVPIVGSWGAEGLEGHANTNAALMAKNTKGSYWLLNAPAVVSSVETKTVLIHEPEIEKVMELSRQANKAIIGIGEISKEATYVKSANMNSADFSLLTIEGAVGRICTSFINERGEEIGTAFSPRMIGIQAEELKKIPQVIAVARGKVKVNAIHAALTGGWVDVLITDIKTAISVLEKEEIRGK